MGAISVVKEHNTNGGGLRLLLIIVRSQNDFYTLLPRLSPISLFFLNLILMSKTFLRTSCESPAVCAAGTSTVNGVQHETLPVAEKTFPTWGACLFQSCVVFYSETIPVPPGACWCTPDELNAWRKLICPKSVLTCFFGDKNKKATGVVLRVRNTKTLDTCHGFSAAVYSERSLSFNWRLWKALEP